MKIDWLIVGVMITTPIIAIAFWYALYRLAVWFWVI